MITQLQVFKIKWEIQMCWYYLQTLVTIVCSCNFTEFAQFTWVEAHLVIVATLQQCSSKKIDISLEAKRMSQTLVVMCFLADCSEHLSLLLLLTPEVRFMITHFSQTLLDWHLPHPSVGWNRLPRYDSYWYIECLRPHVTARTAPPNLHLTEGLTGQSRCTQCHLYASYCWFTQI